VSVVSASNTATVPRRNGSHPPSGAIGQHSTMTRPPPARATSNRAPKPFPSISRQWLREPSRPRFTVFTTQRNIPSPAVGVALGRSSVGSSPDGGDAAGSAAAEGVRCQTCKRSHPGPVKVEARLRAPRKLRLHHREVASATPCWLANFSAPFPRASTPRPARPIAARSVSSASRITITPR